MQDVIFAGAHGVQARAEAEVEVVLDNSDSAVDLPLSEISIVRRLNRAGDGEYRVNGAKCRLTDVLELLSDTGLGKEMHSVVSQGRVAEIVTSKPRDRRMLIEEAAGLGKHRKRRRRAQLKLDRTQDNLDRALDVEREARTRLKPLKRQAEAAELHERIERQTDEARWTLARDAARAPRPPRWPRRRRRSPPRAQAADATEAELREVAERREQAEQALAARGDEREGLSNRFHAARSAHERIGMRLESARQAVDDAGGARRPAPLGAGGARRAEAEADTGDDGAAERVAASSPSSSSSRRTARVRLARGGRRAGGAPAAAAEEALRLGEEADAEPPRPQGGRRGRRGRARRARRELERTAEAARREAARVGAELAKVNQFLRAQAGAPGGAPALADGVERAPGYELALAAALGPRLRAAVAADLDEAARLLDRAGRDGGAALVAPGARRRRRPPAAAPAGRRRAAPPAPSRSPTTSRPPATARAARLAPRAARRRLGRRRRRRARAEASAASPSPATAGCGRPRAASCARCRPAARTGCSPSATGATPWSPRSTRPRAPSTRRSPRSRARRARSRRPTPRATRPTAPRARPAARATRRSRPSAMPAT